MVDEYAEDFFVANRIIFRFAALWPLKSDSKLIQRLHNIHNVVVLPAGALLGGVVVLQIWNVRESADDSLKALSIALVCIMGLYKSLFFRANGAKLKDLMRMLESKEHHYDWCPQKSFFPGLLSTKYKRGGIRNTLVVLVIYYLSILTDLSLPTLAFVLYVLDGGKSERTLPAKLPYDVTLPFNNDSAWLYFWALVFTYVSSGYLCFCALCMDTLFMNFLYNINLQLNLIEGAFLTVRERAAKRTEGPLLTADTLRNSVELRRHLNWELRKICRHQQTVYKVCQDLEDTCNYLFFFQFGSSLLMLCTCLYLVSMLPIKSEAFLHEILYSVVILCQLFVYCWLGNEVTFKASVLDLAIWECDWLSADAGFKSSVILAMQRAQKPLYFKAGKLFPLTMDSFVGIVNKAYAFFTVIKSMETGVE